LKTDVGGNMLSTNVSKLFRINEWLITKLLFNFSFAFYIFYYNSVHLVQVFEPILLICLYIITIGAFGYFINDICDIIPDKAAGRENFSGRLPVFIQTLLLVILATSGILPFLFFTENFFIYLIIVVIQIFLLVIYSVPPLRLKTNTLGPIADSLFSFVFPALISVHITIQFFSLPEIDTIFKAFFLTWLSALGLRSILIHQQKDLDNDILGGDKTFTKSIGLKTSVTLSVSIMIIELIAFIVLVSIIGKDLWVWLLISLSLFILVEMLIFKPNLYKNRDIINLSALINVYYNYYILIALLLMLTVKTDCLYGILITIFILIRLTGHVITILRKFYHRIVLWIYYKYRGARRKILGR
jgi:1,4-dihydroxy-2-naphthoate octaprenyltransferase